MKLVNVSNHKFTPEQVEDLKKNWEILEIVELPTDLKNCLGKFEP